MNILEVLSIDSSRFIADTVTKEVGFDQKKFDMVFNFIFTTKPPLCWRAARVVDLASIKFPELLRASHHKIIVSLDLKLNQSVHRIFLHILIREVKNLIEEDQMRLLDHCLFIITQPIPIAILSYSIDILKKFTVLFPELKPEIELHINNASNNFNKRLHRKI